jgi:hypothetical protein
MVAFGLHRRHTEAVYDRFAERSNRMSEFHLTISENEREMLVRVLSDALKHKRVEVHRTEFSRDFRRELEAEEAQMQSILDRLAHSPALG